MIPLTLFLLGVAAVYVGTVETAFSALMKLSLRLMAERSGEDRLRYYLDDPIQLFVPARLLLGIIFSFATVLLAVLTGRSGVSVASVSTLLACVAVYILVCEHLLPSLIVRRNPEAVLSALLPPFSLVARALSPISKRLLRRLSSETGREQQPVPATDEEAGEVAHAYLEAGEEQGLIERDERRLLQSIVDFGDTLAREVMTPRPDIVAIESDATIGALRALFSEQEYSRFPVYTVNLDNITGVVFVKDLIGLKDASDAGPIAPLVRPATFVPETKRVPELLKEFQRKQVQFAIVVDEGNGSYVFSAKVSFDEVRERLGVDVEPDGFETVGGYVLTRLGRVPTIGETFELDGMHVEVLDAERRRIHKVRFRKAQPELQI